MGNQQAVYHAKKVWLGHWDPNKIFTHQDVSRYTTRLGSGAPFSFTFLDSLEGETEVKQVRACKKHCAMDSALQTPTAASISATFLPAVLRGDFLFPLQDFIAPLPKLSCICYNKIPVMFSKASSLLPTGNPLPHRQPSGSLSQSVAR